MEAKVFDTIIGIDVFSTNTPGIGGRLRVHPEDFIVQEIGSDGVVAPLEPTEEHFPDQPGKFMAFFLVKRNIDTIQAIHRLSKALRVSYKRFSYAGIKDRRALTSQRVTLYRGTYNDLVDLDIPKIWILHPHRVPKPVLSGAHYGNRFRIIIRKLEVTEETRTRITEITNYYKQQGGVLNFFGPQRFGIVNPTTHLIGKHLVLGNLEEAIHILTRSPDEAPQTSKEEIEKNEPRVQYLGHHPNRFFERAVTHYLAKHPGDLQGCLSVLPKGLVRLYVHAYQSYLFNRAVSERVKQGISLTQPCIGDFVVPFPGEIYSTRMVTRKTLASARQKVLNERYKIVIPLIGYDFENITFNGPMGEILKKLLAQEQVTPANFRSTHIPELSSRGSFRPLLVNPTNLQSSITEEKSEKIVTISFDLLKGSYASVILREFIKPRLITQL
ncbi:MAG: tRNA pseudouridine(13) synthase TruD [Promethearchaeota archaeon]